LDHKAVIDRANRLKNPLFPGSAWSLHYVSPTLGISVATKLSSTMAQFFIQCAVCGSEYEITPAGPVSSDQKCGGVISCQVCGALLYENSSAPNTFGVKRLASKESPNGESG
jgi:hypothetical protein